MGSTKWQLLLSRINGSHRGFDLEHSVFNVLIFILILFGLLATVLNFLLDLHAVVQILSVFGTLFLLIMYYHTRIKGVFKVYHIITLLIFSTSLLGIVFFYNAGNDGPIVFMFILMMIILIIVSPEKIQAFIFIYVLAAVVAVYVYEFYYPEAIVPYNSRTAQFVDVITALVYCMGFMALTVIAFKRSYNKERRNVEAKNQELAQLNTDLVRKNEQIQTLMRELNHRVKNNLQVVSGLLSLQANRTGDATITAALNEGKDRLMSMALLHKKLYQEDTFNQVSVKEYLNDLLQHLLDGKGVPENEIKLTKEIEDAILLPHQAVPFGLIINEVITNITKHAFGDPASPPAVNIVCRLVEKNLTVQISDNGKGIDAQKVKIHNTKSSFGLELIDLLVTQLDGAWKIEPGVNGQGTCVFIEFPIISVYENSDR